MCLNQYASKNNLVVFLGGGKPKRCIVLRKSKRGIFSAVELIRVISTSSFATSVKVYGKYCLSFLLASFLKHVWCWQGTRQSSRSWFFFFFSPPTIMQPECQDTMSSGFRANKLHPGLLNRTLIIFFNEQTCIIQYINMSYYIQYHVDINDKNPECITF